MRRACTAVGVQHWNSNHSQRSTARVQCGCAIALGTSRALQTYECEAFAGSAPPPSTCRQQHALSHDCASPRRSINKSAVVRAQTGSCCQAMWQHCCQPGSLTAITPAARGHAARHCPYSAGAVEFGRQRNGRGMSRLHQLHAGMSISLPVGVFSRNADRSAFVSALGGLPSRGRVRNAVRVAGARQRDDASPTLCARRSHSRINSIVAHFARTGAAPACNFSACPLSRILTHSCRRWLRHALG
jgi:hypothetical protein